LSSRWQLSSPDGGLAVCNHDGCSVGSAGQGLSFLTLWPDPRAGKVSKLDARDAPRCFRRHAHQTLFLEVRPSIDLFQGKKLEDVRGGEIPWEEL
jgi:hypothetical protein